MDVTGGLGVTEPDVGHLDLSPPSATHNGVNTLRLSPGGSDTHVTVGVVPVEAGGLLLDDVGSHFVRLCVLSLISGVCEVDG